jgi:hypothetical protein
MSDEFAAAVQSEEYKAWKDDKPAQEPVVEAKPEPAAPVVETRARNADGTFAPATEKPAERVEPLPFDGFDKLDPSVQAQFRRLTGERDDFKVRYTRQLGHTRQLARTASPANRPAGNELANARRDASALAPGAQRDAIQSQLDKWEAHKAAYPDEANAIDQRIAAFRDDLASGINPLAQEVQHLRSVVEELQGGYQSVQQERAERYKQESFETFGKLAGDNWRQIAGLEDENGKQIPTQIPGPNGQMVRNPDYKWHPEFVAWVDGHDPDIAQHYWQTLYNPSPRVSAQVVAEFNRERFGLEDAGTQDGKATADPVAARRAESLRDIQPGGARARTSAPATWAPTGDAYADAVRSEDYKKWREA